MDVTTVFHIELCYYFGRKLVCRAGKQAGVSIYDVNGLLGRIYLVSSTIPCYKPIKSSPS